MRLRTWIAFGLAALIATPALAAPPDKAMKGGKGGPPEKVMKGGGKSGGKDGGDVKIELNFNTTDRRIISDYYGPMIDRGSCPPGLAKKHNGCRPPGQAKQWNKGHPLPPGVTWYPLPGELVMRLPIPPAGHEYVRVGADILMITAGSMMVVDAITDLGRM